MYRAAALLLVTLLGCSLERGGAAIAPVDGAASGGAFDASGMSAVGGNQLGGNQTGTNGASDGQVATGDLLDASSAAPADAGRSDAGSFDAGPHGTTPSAGSVGAPCAKDGECSGLSARCLSSIPTSGGGTREVPNGYCTRSCNPQLGTLACGQDARCPDSFKLCVRTCKRDDDCRSDEGYVCKDEVCTLPGL